MTTTKPIWTAPKITAVAVADAQFGPPPGSYDNGVHNGTYHS